MDQKTPLRFAGTAAVEFGRPVLLRAWDTSGFEDTSKRKRAQGNAFVLVEQLAEKGIVTPPVFGLSELDHLLANALLRPRLPWAREAGPCPVTWP